MNIPERIDGVFRIFVFGDSEYSNSNPITRRDIPSATPRVISPMGFRSGTTKAVKSARADWATLVMSRVSINVWKLAFTFTLSTSIEAKDRDEEVTCTFLQKDDNNAGWRKIRYGSTGG